MICAHEDATLLLGVFKHINASFFTQIISLRKSQNYSDITSACSPD